MKFIHSADWQLGARFTQFGAKAELLRKARLQTLETALKKGAESDLDAFLIAGDLFQDSQVDDPLVDFTLSLFAQFPKLRPPARDRFGNDTGSQRSRETLS